MVERLVRDLQNEATPEDLYATYQSLSMTVHGGLNADRYFRLEGNCLQRVEYIEMPIETPKLFLTVAFYMVWAVFAYFTWDCSHIAKQYQDALDEAYGEAD